MQISQYRFHQIIEKWTFLNSTRKGQLKNVQDGISRPLGSQEIQKTKVERVLLDTLYINKGLEQKKVEIFWGTPPFSFLKKFRNPKNKLGVSIGC